ncbi:hypothetical protein HZA97_06700 [Candidatus Woesearchaeota archaeon]|nr:hypothetical protein [Candidatus Woesearchaeota archaeon]
MPQTNLFKGEEGQLFLEELITKIKAQEPDKWIYTLKVNKEKIELKQPETNYEQSDQKVIFLRSDKPTLGFAESKGLERQSYYYSNHQEIYKTRIDLLDVILENVKENNIWGETVEKDTYSLIVMVGEQIGTTHGSKIKEVFELVKQKVSEYKKKEESTKEF